MNRRWESTGSSLRPYVLVLAALLAFFNGCGKDSYRQSMNQGDTLFAQGNHQGAIACYSRAFRHSPENPEPLLKRAAVEKTRKEYVKAINDLTLAAKLSPLTSEQLAIRGECYIAIGRYTDSLNDFDKAISMEASADLLAKRAEAHLGKLDYQSAIDDLSEAIEQEGRNPEPLVLRGMAYSSQGDFSAAEADFSEAIKIRSDYAYAYWLRSKTYAQRGDLVDAAVDQAKAIQLDPSLQFGDSEIGNDMLRQFQSAQQGSIQSSISSDLGN